MKQLPQPRIRISTKRIVHLFYLLVLGGLTALTITTLDLSPAINIEHESSLSSKPGRPAEIIPTEKGVKNCDRIHLALVCGGFNATRNTYVLLKSILFYRTNVLKLHLFVDDISRTILLELFSTWNVPDFSYQLYNITHYEQEVAWIPSLHYSHRFGLMKLVFLSLLLEDEANLSQVIMLDTDMLALGNINLIWNMFNQLKSQSSEIAIGLVENQSDWYLGNGGLSGSRPIWPALNRGFNTGLMIVDLKRLGALNWNILWRQVTETQLISHLSTTLADQDIINAVVRENIKSVVKLPCVFNLQLNDHTKLDETCPMGQLDENILIVHWNSPYKFNTKNPRAKHFEDWYINFRNWDAKLLERIICYPARESEENELNATNAQHTAEIDICSELQPRPSDRLRTFLYFMPYELANVDHFDVTAVVHLSYDRFRTLNDLAAHWSGPISASIYLSELETNLLLTSIQYGEHLVNRKNIAYHLVFRDHGFNYPINKLRNIALKNSITPYVFLLDIDFLPSFNLYDYLKTTINLINQRDEDEENTIDYLLDRKALVVPAFENLKYKFDFPASKTELETQLNLGSVSIFREQLWPRGHLPTDYAKWRMATQLYNIDWKPEYEPFIVTNRDVPHFDERFIGFGWNKVEHIMQLAAMDYQFLVLPEAFVIHQFHSPSYDIIKHRESHKYRSCIRQIKKNFLIELSSNYPEFFSRLSTSSTLAPGSIDEQIFTQTNNRSNLNATR